MSLFFSLENLDFIIWVAVFAAVYGFAEFCYGVLKVPGVYTRKFIHIVCGFLLIYYPFIVSSYLTVLLVCAIVFVCIYIARSYKRMPSLFDVDYNTDGSMYYLINLVTLSYIWSYHTESFMMYRLPLSILTFADPIAALIGRKYPYKMYGSGGKTLSGSVAFFVVSLIVTYIFMSTLFYEYTVIQIWVVVFVVAIVTTIIEAVSTKGLDNITVSVSSALVLWMLKAFYLGAHL